MYCKCQLSVKVVESLASTYAPASDAGQLAFIEEAVLRIGLFVVIHPCR